MFLRFNIFYLLEMKDKWPVPIIDILTKLPLPNDAGNMSRTSGMTFKFDFSAFKLDRLLSIMM